MLRSLVARMVSVDWIWRSLDATVLKFARYAAHAREEQRVAAMATSALRQRIPDLVVRHGPFCGMRYPSAASAGSTLFPKLLGSYERELHPAIAEFRDAAYGLVVDVGCAEGYYAVGLARSLPSATVYAFDIDQRARELCRELAAVNDVQDRVVIGGACDPATLQSLVGTHAGLVVCDAEGYEIELFTPQTIAALAEADVLIEVHDNVDPTIGIRLRDRFSASHDLTIVESVDDLLKAETYDYPELDGLDMVERLTLLGERRSMIMRWHIYRSRTEHSGK